MIPFSLLGFVIAALAAALLFLPSIFARTRKVTSSTDICVLNLCLLLGTLLILIRAPNVWIGEWIGLGIFSAALLAWSLFSKKKRTKV
jgi:hypothetical protein